MAKTLSGVATDVSERLGDTAAAVWSAAEIKRYLKEGYSLLATETGCFWEDEWLNDVASQATYTVPTALIRIERATWDNRRVDPLHADELLAADAQFMSTTGQPQAYVMNGDGLRVLRKWPIPTVSTTGTAQNFKIEYTRKGNALTVDASEFELPDRYVKYCRHYACWRCLEREGKGQDLDLAVFYRQLYEEGKQRMIRRKGAIAKARLHGYGVEKRQTGPQRPRLPWAYGKVVD